MDGLRNRYEVSGVIRHTEHPNCTHCRHRQITTYTTRIDAENEKDAKRQAVSQVRAQYGEDAAFVADPDICIISVEQILRESNAPTLFNVENY